MRVGCIEKLFGGSDTFLVSCYVAGVSLNDVRAELETRGGLVFMDNFVIFFFFQAEDGIRDIGVTGVQTCALPIFERHPSSAFSAPSSWTISGLTIAKGCPSCTSITAMRSRRPTCGAARPMPLAEIGRASCRERV